MLTEFLVRLINLISPKRCAVCGCRLSIGEDVICSVCNIHLPRTHYTKAAFDNKMAKLFYGQIPIERAAALFFYERQSETSRIIHSMKYFGHPETALFMGRMLAEEAKDDDFFDGIDAIIPIPITRKRQRERGYNQSEYIAKGVNEITGIPIIKGAVTRKTFGKSQTKMNRWQRNDNVKDAFHAKDNGKLKGKHILIIDDIVTTGATIISCVNEIKRCGDIKVSVLSLGFTAG